jgi:hypothetical protein
VLLKQLATLMVMGIKNAENDYKGVMITQTINIYNKDSGKYDHMFVCVCEYTLQWQNVLPQQSSSELIPVAAPLKARVYGRSFVGNARRISLGARISISC